MNDQDELKARLLALEEEAARLRAAMGSEAVPEAETEAEVENCVEAEEELPAPTAAQIAEAERLLAAARVAKMRGQKAEADKLALQAQAAAPNAPAVIEAIGDDFRERNQTKKAETAYKQALKYDPDNISLQRKHAEMVLRNDAVANAMMHMTDEGAFEAVATAKSATLFSLILPGLGQIVSGQIGKGVFLMGGWVVGMVWVMLTPGGIPGLLKAVTGASSQFNASILVPLFIAVICHFVSIFDAASRAKGSTKRRINRPVPPSNLPFE